MRKRIINSRYFYVEEQRVNIQDVPCNLIRVWLGPPNNPESERIMTIGREYIPALIASLRGINIKSK
jgi:hypothetical protein